VDDPPPHTRIGSLSASADRLGVLGLMFAMKSEGPTAELAVDLDLDPNGDLEPEAKRVSTISEPDLESDPDGNSLTALPSKDAGDELLYLAFGAGIWDLGFR